MVRVCAGRGELTKTDETMATIPPTPMEARLPASISRSPPVVCGRQSVGVSCRVTNVQTVTVSELPFRLEVVTSQAIRPEKKPAIEPIIQPHLFAFFQHTHSAIGTTAEPSTTPMNSCLQMEQSEGSYRL